MENFKNLLLILYAATGVALIGLGIFKKIKIFEGEKIEKLKELQIVNTISSIIFGIIFIAEAYYCYLGKLHWGVLVASIVFVEVFQQMQFKHYIKPNDTSEIKQTTELAEDINLDEIMDEDFFKNKQKEEEQKNQEELQRKAFEEYQKKQKEESSKVLSELLEEGYQLGILGSVNEEENKEETKKHIVDKNDNVINLDFK